jgi:branched-chain amino acid transport system ATP-binding protein
VKPILEVQNVSFNYGPIQALNNVAFHVNEGEIVTMLGANGAGKTTLLKTISGLLKPSQGRILYRNEDIAALTPEKIVQKHLIHVPEHRQIFSTLTVEDNLQLGAFHHFKKTGKKDLQESVRKMYSLFPILEERKKQLAGTLSGGQQQMLAIARALMAKPALLLLDEPSLGLAPLIVKEVLQYVKQLRDEWGVTILLIEQNVNAALKIADRGYVMAHGAIVKEGAAADLQSDREVREAFLGQTVT